ncbi:hypothetical protein GCM10010440_75960 [Kitasatospora cinereorecta]
MDRGKPGSKMHILSDAGGLPLVVDVTAANTHDSKALKPVVEAHLARRAQDPDRWRKPGRLHADKAFDVPHLRKWLRGKRIGVRIARKGIESSERLGRRRWVIERTMSWMTGYRRLSPRYERDPGNYLAFLRLAAALCCYKRLVAALPTEQHHRPTARPHNGLTVEHRDKKGRVETYRFDSLPVGAELQHAFATWFAEKCVPGGGWDSCKSSRGMWHYLLAFCRFCSVQDNPPQLLDDLTPALWNRWRMRRPDSIYGYHQVTALGSFLRTHPELSEATRAAMARRLPDARTKERALTPDEFQDIRVAARQMFRSAHMRIHESTEHLDRWRQGSFEPGSPDWVVGQALDSLARTGFVPHSARNNGWKRNLPETVSALGGDTARHTWMRLFLSRAEAYALSVLLVMEFGLNASVVSELRTPHAAAGTGPGGLPIYRLELEKPRRGAGRHFETRNVPDTGADSAGRLITQALEATAHARAFVAAADPSLGFLLVWRNSLPGPRNVSPVTPFGIGLTKNAADCWLRETGLTGAPLRRMRKTVNALHRREPGQNSQETHDRMYVLSEPQVQEAAVPIIAEGAESALAHARQTVLRAKLAASAQAGAKETPTADCTDYENSPFGTAGAGCTASFLLCTACPNARIHPKHHSRLAHLHRSLSSLRSVLGEELWTIEWGEPFMRLNDLKRRLGDAVWSQTLAGATAADKDLVRSLLEGKYDL